MCVVVHCQLIEQKLYAFEQMSLDRKSNTIKRQEIVPFSVRPVAKTRRRPSPGNETVR